ncbi:MAG: zinc ribbon domain-containing protein [Calditrichia bacterium]
MPIYEFYCKDCHTIYKFFSRTVNTTKIPACPKCDNPALERQVSRFAILSGKHKSDEGEDGFPPIDESKMEQAMAALGKEVEHLDEDDPKQAARLMRKLSEMTGLKMGDAMEEALARMEKGEDPEAIEEELGDLMDSEDEDLLFQVKNGPKSPRTSRPRKDDTLYDL